MNLKYKYYEYGGESEPQEFSTRGDFTLYSIEAISISYKVSSSVWTPAYLLVLDYSECDFDKLNSMFQVSVVFVVNDKLVGVLNGVYIDPEEYIIHPVSNIPKTMIDGVFLERVKSDTRSIDEVFKKYNGHITPEYLKEVQPYFEITSRIDKVLGYTDTGIRVASAHFVNPITFNDESSIDIWDYPYRELRHVKIRSDKDCAKKYKDRVDQIYKMIFNEIN